jgi:hypothetical protein
MTQDLVFGMDLWAWLFFWGVGVVAPLHFIERFVVMWAGRSVRWLVPESEKSYAPAFYKPRFIPDWPRGLVFMRPWAVLVMPSLLCLRGLLVPALLEDGRPTGSFVNDVVFSLLLFLPLGGLLLIWRRAASQRQASDESQ